MFNGFHFNGLKGVLYMNLSFVASIIFMLLYWVTSMSGAYGTALIMFGLTMVFLGLGIYQAFAKGNKKNIHLKTR